MGYIIGAGGAVLFVSMLFLLISKEKSLRGIEKQRKELEQEVKSIQSECRKAEEKNKKIWKLANTIHLYAALSEEEIKVEAVKQKQQEIMDMAEELLRIAEKQEEM